MLAVLSHSHRTIQCDFERQVCLANRPVRARRKPFQSEVLQHKVLAISVLTLGLIELMRRLELMTHIAWLYLFYGLAILPGVILLVHDFSAALHAHAHSLTVSHILMGLLALLALVLKVLVDHRLIIGRWAHLYPLVLTGLGIQLLLFTESSEIVR